MNTRTGVAPAELPVLPALKGRGMAALWNSHSDLRDFVAIVEGDAGLTASVLRAANSSFSAPTGPILTAAQALNRIGVDAAHQIVSAAFARSEFENLTRSDVHFEDYWSWQLAVALLTECFCLYDRRPADEIEAAFTAGLLHQVGRLALIAHSPENYRDVVKLATTGVDPLEAEWEILRDHATHVTAQVGAHWGFFEPLPSTLAALGNAEVSGLAAIVREARSVASQLGYTEGFSLTVPSSRPLPETHPRHAALAAIGGPEELTREIQWFHRASGGRTPLSLRDAGDQGSERLAS